MVDRLYVYAYTLRVYKYALHIQLYNATMPDNLYILRKEVGDGGHCLGDDYTLHQRHLLAKACELHFATSTILPLV